MEFAQPASMTGMVAGYRQRNGKQNNVAILKLSYIYILEASEVFLQAV